MSQFRKYELTIHRVGLAWRWVQVAVGRKRRRKWWSGLYVSAKRVM